MSQSSSDNLNPPLSASAGESVDELETDVPETSETDSGVAESLPLDVVFDMLKNERRRRVLEYLRDEEGPFTLGELAEHIAALENDKTIAALNSTERKRVYVGLYQCHLPRMADAGVIEFDRHRGTVRDGPNSEQLYPYIDVDSEPDGSPRIYLGLVAVCGVGLLATILSQAQYVPVVSSLFLVSLGGYALAEHVGVFES